MAFKTLSERVAEAQAAMQPAQGPAPETHRISNPRQHDIDRLLSKLDDAALAENKKPDYTAARANVAKLLQENAQPSAPRRQKVPSDFAKQVQGIGRPRR